MASRDSLLTITRQATTEAGRYARSDGKGLGLPRDNKTRLAVRGVHLHRLRRIASTAQRIAADIEALPPETMFTAEDEDCVRYSCDLAARALASYSDSIIDLVLDEKAELIARSAEYHRLLARINYDRRAEEAATVARIRHTEPRPAPPGAELVSVVSLAPHAPPAEAHAHTSPPEGVT